MTQPFQVGRGLGVALQLTSAAVSKVHAELVQRGVALYVCDLGSTNGTYVNGQPVRGELQVTEGDLIQFADTAFRVFESAELPSQTAVQFDRGSAAQSLVQFDRMLRDRAVIPYYQPLVCLGDRRILGYEVLGRSRFFGLRTPKEMFLAASQLNLESELSELFRIVGLEEGCHLPGLPHLFLNTHPNEVVEFGLLDSLRQLRADNPLQPITLEIHEAAVTNPRMMHRIREDLRALNIGLAYDDFGAGRSRLTELTQVRPDYLKFDMGLVQGLDRAERSQQTLVRSLVQISREMGIVTLAEGVETEGEHEACVAAGFEMGQGYLYGRPRAAVAPGAPAEQTTDAVIV